MLFVAAYCRVSTDKEDQANSFESQKKYFEEYINRNPDWELVGIYADEGLTGTNTRKRKAFNKMIADAHLGKFNLVLTKEVSRFARNTVDTLQYTRQLKAMNIGVRFMLDNIDTLKPDGEMRLTIMASLAQEESRKTSERVKWGQKRQMEKGIVFGGNMLGYNVRDGKMYIEEVGAEIIRLIFHKFVYEQKGANTIATELGEAGYKTLKGNVRWSKTSILKVLHNEKYCGALVQKKTFTPDFLTHEKKYNRGEEEFVVIKNHHEPIVSGELWEMAQRELKKRAASDETKSRHSDRYLLSGKIYCGCCGKRFVARHKNRKDGSRYKAWRCYEAARYGLPKTDCAGNHIGCAISSHIRDETFMLIIKKVVGDLQINGKTVISGLEDILSNVLAGCTGNEFDGESVKKKISTLEKKTEKLLDLHLSGDISKSEYLDKKENYKKQITQLQTDLKKISKNNITYVQTDLLSEIREYMTSMLSGKQGSEQFYKTILDKIIVHDAQHFDIHLKLLPFKWSVALESVVNDGTLSKYVSEKDDPSSGCISDTMQVLRFARGSPI